ncbi:hypothetical protein P3L10_020533 [Capsicum annuum]
MDLVTSTNRPVQLTWHFSSNTALLPLLDDKGTSMNSRNGCEVAIQYLEDCRLLDECKTSEVELPLKRFCIQYPNVVRVSPLKASIKEWLHDKWEI